MMGRELMLKNGELEREKIGEEKEGIINEMTDEGADYCFEYVGKSSLVQEAYSCGRKVSS
ncbi:hypothetical protein ACS0TY_001674 [Phlomoides rotata]